MIDRMPDARIDLHLFTTRQGGRNHDVVTSSWKCRAAAGGRFFDVLIETDGELGLGSTNRVRSYFLDWPSASEHVLVGAQLAIYERQQVGEAKVVDVAARTKAPA